ncbi:MAG: type IV pilus secretin PilQ family protein [Proteobacteria bacterium]|nr:type IV pilus secretin PilQ family protein [Pseudomonadota bacterium]
MARTIHLGIPFIRLFCLLFALISCCTKVLGAGPVLEDLKVVSLDGGSIRLNIKTNVPVKAPKSFVIENPAKICLDFIGVKNGLTHAKSRTDYSVGVVKRVSVVEGEGKTRVIIDLSNSIPFDVKMENNQAVVTLAPGIPSRQAITDPFRGQYSSQTPNEGSKYCLTAIDFRRGNEGEGKVIVDLSSVQIPVELREEADKIRVRFINTQLPAHLQHKLDVTDFGTPVISINTIGQGKDVEMVIQNQGFTENIAYQADKRFTVDIRPLTKEEKDQIQKKTFKYTGDRLSLNFQDIEVRAVLQLIADFTGLNIVTSDSVTGNVTLRLHNVPWDQALDIILTTKGLAKRQVGNVMLIGPSEEMAAREKQELQNSQQVVDLAPLHAEYIQVNYAKASDLAALLKTEKNSLLSSRGTVSVDERTNTLLVQDTAVKLEEIRALVQRLDIPIRQVLIESRLVFATDNFQEVLGVSWGTAGKGRPGREPIIGFAGQVLGPGLTGSSTIATGITTPAQVVVPDRAAFTTLGTTTTDGTTTSVFPLAGSSTTQSSFGVTLARLPGGTILDLEIQALESEGLGKVVASPRLVTSNQQMAYIESGEEIPYQESTSSGAASIAFKKAVLRLEVTPQITPDDHIIMDLKVNQDSRGVVTANVPSINTRELHTKVLVNNGDTVVLGGIYQQTKQVQDDEVPFFGKLPLIGWMFRSHNALDQRSELLIFVTPKIIQDGMAS